MGKKKNAMRKGRPHTSPMHGDHYCENCQDLLASGLSLTLDAIAFATPDASPRYVEWVVVDDEENILDTVFVNLNTVHGLHERDGRDAAWEYVAWEWEDGHGDYLAQRKLELA